jgi:tRNA U34 5-carboxymethylaminomethyl modifying GTPase MnmE/TrmE
VWRVILLGRGSVGKSGLVRRLADPESAFDPNYVVSRGYRETRIRFMAAQGEEVLMDVVDTSGQECPLAEARGQVANQCYQGADGALVMFDLHRPTTLEKGMMYMTDLRAAAGDQVHYVFVGTKSDKTHYIDGTQIGTPMRHAREVEGYNVVRPCLKISLMHGQLEDFMKPFTRLARKFFNNETLTFVSCQWEPANDA